MVSGCNFTSLRNDKAFLIAQSVNLGDLKANECDIALSIFYHVVNVLNILIYQCKSRTVSVITVISMCSNCIPRD